MCNRLLIVEDYQPLRDLMQDVLGDICGHAVEIAADAESATRLASSEAFDLVLLDIGLAGPLSGWDIAKVVRTHGPCPILFISGHDPDPATRARHIRPSDLWLRKPFRIEVLVAKVKELLKGGEPRVPAAS